MIQTKEETLQHLESETWEKIFCWNLESWALESRIQLKESGIPLTIGMRTPSSSNKDQNPVPGIRISPRRGIQNPRSCWILLHGTIVWTGCPKPLWRAVLKKQIHWFRGRRVDVSFKISASQIYGFVWTRPHTW